MRVRLYQVKESASRDFLFRSFRHLPGYPTREKYDMVFNGEVDADDIEYVFVIFNVNHPEGFRGHSMSVSDVLEVLDGDTPGLYFCDNIGFKPLDTERFFGRG